jgi:sulfatase modifying factor 1
MNLPQTRPIVFALLIISSLFAGGHIQAQLVTIETVPVGDPNNVAYMPSSSDAIGSVAYRYEISKYEVTLTQYAAFLNAVAKFDSVSYLVDLWDSQLQFDDNVAGIVRAGSGLVGDPYVYAVIGDGDRPVSNLSWFDAARFANWVNNGATAGASTETGSYTLNGATSGFISPNASAVWRLASADEWFKAAYYKGGGTNAGYWKYATRSDVSPGNVVGGGTNQANYRIRGRYAVTQSTTLDGSQNYLTTVGAFTGSASAYNTFDQTGNVTEWTDGLLVFTPPGMPAETNRAAFGGSWTEDFDASSFEAVFVDRNARFGALPEVSAFGFRLVKLGSADPTPTPTPTPTPRQQTVRLSLPAKVVYGSTYKLTASASSKLPLTFSVSDPSIAQLTGRRIKILQAKPFQVTATQAGNSKWASGFRTVDVIPSKRSQRVGFTVKRQAKVGQTLNLNVTLQSGLPVTIASSDVAKIRISSDFKAATVLGVGIVKLTATQLGDDNHAAAKPVERTVVVK